MGGVLVKEMMKAALFYQSGEPLEITEVKVPVPGTGEALVKIKSCGICGSDIHIAYEGITPTGFTPIILGHEPSGIVAAAGPDMKDFQPGDRVAVSSCVTCGSCENCLTGRESICINRKMLGIHLNGGLAEYMTTPARNLVKLPENISFEQGAIITDAVATPFHAIVKRGKIQAGETVAVFGCGGLGIHAVQIAKICGASQIIAVDVNETALNRAKNVGATDTVLAHGNNPAAAIKELTKGYGVELAVECVGHQDTIAAGVESLKSGGRLVIVGLGAQEIKTLPPTLFVRNEYTILGSYAWDRADLVSIMKLAEKQTLDLSGSITKRFNLDSSNEALKELHDKTDDPIRIVINQD